MHRVLALCYGTAVMRGLGKFLFLWLGVAAGAGCVHSGFQATTTMALAPRPEGCYLDVILDGVPPFAYVVIGRVTTDSTAPGLWGLSENSQVAMERMQEEACRAGAHGILQPNAQSQGSWTKDGYSRSTTGAAVAFVYVDPSGRPLPPPRGPHVIIHPGAAAAPAPPPPRPAISAPAAPAAPPPAPAISAPGATSAAATAAAPSPGQ